MQKLIKNILVAALLLVPNVVLAEGLLSAPSSPAAATKPSTAPVDCTKTPADPICRYGGDPQCSVGGCVPGSTPGSTTFIPVPADRLSFQVDLLNKQKYFFIDKIGNPPAFKYGAQSNLPLQFQISKQKLAPNQFYELSPAFAASLSPEFASGGAKTYIWVGQ